MTQPSTAHALLVPALLVVMSCTACHFDARARPHGESGQQAATALPPVIDAAVGTAPTPPAAGQSAPPIQTPAGGGPASSGAAAPVVMQPDAAAPPSDTSDAGAPAADAAATPDAAVVEDAAADAMAIDAMTVDDAGSSGAAFSACRAHADCNSGLWCTGVAWGTAASGGYCAAICGSGGGMSDNGCLQPGSGSLTARCQPATALCELGSCDQQSCPDGLRCARVETPIGGGQIVYTFVCGP